MVDMSNDVKVAEVDIASESSSVSHSILIRLEATVAVIHDQV